MKSIRRSLFVWLFSGLSVLSAVAGISLYAIVSSGLQARFDADLSHLASGVPLAVLASDAARGKGLATSRWEPFFEPHSGRYYEVWAAGGQTLARSRSLGETHLPHPGDLTAEPRYWDLVLPGGERLRATGGRIELPVARSGVTNTAALAEGGRLRLDMVVAIRRTGLDHALHRLALVLTCISLLVALGFALLVRTAVGFGLRPLNKVAERTAEIRADHLSERFPVEGAPEELRPIIDRLNDLMARLEAGFERERRFSADLAHELRTPVAELRTAAEVALQWPDAPHEENYRDVLEISQHMQTILESLLTLARSSGAHPDAAAEPCAIAAIVAECWDPFAAKARDKGVTVEFAIDPPLSARLQRGLFKIVVSNLLSNAAEYTPPGGRIRVEARPGPSDTLELTVANTAPDLRAADIPHLFERFWRRDEARSGGKHHGLGLCIAKSCAEALSCTLTAELDEVRQWLTFRLNTAPEAPEAGSKKNS